MASSKRTISIGSLRALAITPYFRVLPCLLLLFGGYGCTNTTPQPVVPDTAVTTQIAEAVIAPVEVGDSLPRISVRLLSGDSVRIGGSSKQPLTLLNLWATWCGPCKREFPEIQRIHDTYSQRGLRVLAVSTDVSDGAVTRYLMTTRFTFPVGRDSSNQMLKAFRLEGLPQNLLVDRRGRVIWMSYGVADTALRSLVAAIDSAIAD